MCENFLSKITQTEQPNGSVKTGSPRTRPISAQNLQRTFAAMVRSSLPQGRHSNSSDLIPGRGHRASRFGMDTHSDSTRPRDRVRDRSTSSVTLSWSASSGEDGHAMERYGGYG